MMPGFVQRTQLATASLIRFISLVLTGIIAISFISFVWDEAGTASKNQTVLAQNSGQQIAIVRDERGRLTNIERHKIRQQIDGFADSLTSPGEEIGKQAGGGNAWAMRGGAFIFGILLFAVALRLLAGWMDWSAQPKNEDRSLKTEDEDYTPGYR